MYCYKVSLHLRPLAMLRSFAKSLLNLYKTFSLILLGNRCKAITNIIVSALIIM